jgi:UDP-N-acetylglucosamine--N-acetylmuramyl-(pentapeptide) pyrophosphoryl-undecaprenol N-acetylglucosamine transferase
MVQARPVVLAAGGTGGHVFPAEALARELETRGVPFALITDSRGKQWQGALAHQPIHYIHSASPTAGSLHKRAMAVLSLGIGLVDAWWALGRIRPSAVVGFGGYASVPTMFAARLRRLPSMLHEQNAVVGKANRLVLGGVERVATSFQPTRGLENDRRARLVGNPVRDPVRALRGSPYRAPGTDRVIDILIFAGSQGAASFSKVIPDAILSLPAPLRARLRVVQQCRREDIGHVRTMYKVGGIVAELAPFFPDMPQRLAAAHLVIARSGASTVAELAVIGRPSILIPYPHHTDEHQVVNARALEAVGAAILMQHAGFTAAALAEKLTALFEEPQRLAAMAAAAHGAGRPDAAMRLADMVGELIAAPQDAVISGVAA